MTGTVVAQKQTVSAQRDLFIQDVFSLSEVMLHDVVNPPAASRFYAYSMLGGYIASCPALPLQEDNLMTSLQEKIVMAVTRPSDYVSHFAGTYAMLDVGRQLLPSGYRLEPQLQDLQTIYRKKFKLSPTVLASNVAYARAVADAVVAYARRDGYLQLSTRTRYTPSDEPGRWYPTPPEYMGAVEPEWRTIRPFFVDSAAQFRPTPPAPFTLQAGSSFRQQLDEVYQVSRQLTDEQRAIAAFWDCNPFAVAHAGHAAIGLKKISPGGHWMGITGIACRQAQADFELTVKAHVLVALTLHDAFLSCWEAKYQYDRIRPESAINKHVDASWRPLLQTPPFPEYTSGHSVISTASAEILTHLFGDSFTFTDTSEMYFGLPARTFHSFRDAAAEAAVSRLYGGIHFRDAIEAGVQQGKSISLYILQKISKAK